MSARVIPDLKPNEDYKLLREEIFKIIQQWALCGLDFVFSWNWYSHRPWEGDDTALWNLHRAFHCIVHLLLVYRVTCLNSVNTRLISSLPRQFYLCVPWSSVFSWLGDAEDTRRPGLSRSRASWHREHLGNQSGPASWRPHASPDTGHGAHYRATRPRYRGIIVLFVFPVCYLLSV